MRLSTYLGTYVVGTVPTIDMPEKLNFLYEDATLNRPGRYLCTGRFSFENSVIIRIKYRIMYHIHN